MHFTVTILGNNSAIPANGRHPTSQVVHLNAQTFLVDAGEGVQMQMQRYKVKKSKINHIFISHLHGDHYFGLIGLINSLGLQSRTEPLHIYGPPPLQKIIQIQLDSAYTRLPFPLHFHPLERGQNGIIHKEPGIEVFTFPTNHRIDCFGFLFKEKHEQRKILPEKVQEANIPYFFYNRLKKGEDYIDYTGKKIPNHQLTAPPQPEHAYAFCADTKYDERLIPFIKEADLIYHEATYLEEDLDKAINRFHSTAQQAATLAKKADVGRLLIGHFSSRYKDLYHFEKESQKVFPPSEISQEGATYFVKKYS